VHSRLNQLLHSNNILVTERYDFRIGISTDDAAVRITDSVFKYVNQIACWRNFLLFSKGF
jgi:hypothetical protein